MQLDSLSRRDALGGLSLIGLGAAGVNLITGSRSPQMVQSYTTTYIDEPIVDLGFDQKDNQPYFSSLITDPIEEKSYFKQDLLPESRKKDWSGINYNNRFIAILISKFEITSQEYDGDQPKSLIDGRQFEFIINTNSFNTSKKNLFTQIELWSLNGHKKPRGTKVSLQFDT